MRGEGEGGKRKGWIAGLYRPPTHEELQSLKETQNLFQSNLMRLQVQCGCWPFRSLCHLCLLPVIPS